MNRKISQRITRRFINGLILLVPIAITLFVVSETLNFTEGVLGRHLPFYFPGLGILTLLAVIYITGWLSSYWFMRRVIRYGEALVGKIPVVKFIYNSVKHLSTAVFESNSMFDHVVLVPFHQSKALGFLMADVSSDFLARKINVSDFGVIYGGAQKNISCAGVTVTIIRKDLLGKVDRTIPTMLNFQTHIDAKNMFNTPPVFAVYVMNRTLKWLKEFGGVEAIEKLNREKAALLYSALDASKVFVGTAAKEDRSIMNVPFVFNKDVVAVDKADDLAKEFLEFAKARGLQQLKGHRSVGGFRASIYNAMPMEGVQALVDCLGDFEKKVLA